VLASHWHAYNADKRSRDCEASQKVLKYFFSTFGYQYWCFFCFFFFCFFFFLNRINSWDICILIYSRRKKEMLRGLVNIDIRLYGAIQNNNNNNNNKILNFYSIYMYIKPRASLIFLYIMCSICWHIVHVDYSEVPGTKLWSFKIWRNTLAEMPYTLWTTLNRSR
jgi:hypothetical protein